MFVAASSARTRRAHADAAAVFYSTRRRRTKTRDVKRRARARVCQGAMAERRRQRRRQRVDDSNIHRRGCTRARAPSSLHSSCVNKRFGVDPVARARVSLRRVDKRHFRLVRRFARNRRRRLVFSANAKRSFVSSGVCCRILIKSCKALDRRRRRKSRSCSRRLTYFPIFFSTAIASLVAATTIETRAILSPRARAPTAAATTLKLCAFVAHRRSTASSPKVGELPSTAPPPPPQRRRRRFAVCTLNAAASTSAVVASAAARRTLIADDQQLPPSSCRRHRRSSFWSNAPTPPLANRRAVADLHRLASL